MLIEKHTCSNEIMTIYAMFTTTTRTTRGKYTASKKVDDHIGGIPTFPYIQPNLHDDIKLA